MIPTKFLYGNYLDVLADACASTPSAADVPAVAALAVSALRAGSHVDVFCEGCFWEAEVLRVCSGRLRYRYLHTGARFEGGWVSVGDFLLRWRFPVRTDGDVWNARLLAESLLSCADPQTGKQLW